jgi:hypothetical protein
MREVLNQSSDDEDDDSQLAHNASSLSVSQSAQSDSQVCFLYSAFMSNVDPVVKILPRPSLQRYFIEDKYLRHCNVAVPVQRYTVLVADIILATMWLFAYRPLQ